MRAAITVAVVVGVSAAVLVAESAVNRYHEHEQSLIAREIELAQPFLALDKTSQLEMTYQDLDPNGMGGYGHVVVTFETDDPASLVREIQSVMRSEGWTPDGNDDMRWRLGQEGHIWVEDNDVSVFIGTVEG